MLEYHGALALEVRQLLLTDTQLQTLVMVGAGLVVRVPQFVEAAHFRILIAPIAINFRAVFE